MPISRFFHTPRPKRLNAFWFLVLLLPLLLTDNAEAVSITDDFGTVIQLNQPARRIICLYGAMNEILETMGLSDRIIARTNADDFSATIRTKPSIGTHMRPNVELVVGLHPDLILQMAGRKGVSEPLNALEQHGIPTALFRVETMDELYAMITRMGIITGASDQANTLVRSMQERVSRVQKKLGPHPIRPNVFFEVRYPNLLAAGQHSIVSEIISLAGGTNGVPQDKKLVRLSEEELLNMNPDVYVLQKGPMNPNPVLPKKRPHFRTLQAVKTDRVLVVDEHLFSRPGPETVTAIEMLAEYLHPEQ
jgi:iron complex transport system substrate-binding protein